MAHSTLFRVRPCGSSAAMSGKKLYHYVNSKEEETDLCLSPSWYKTPQTQLPESCPGLLSHCHKIAGIPKNNFMFRKKKKCSAAMANAGTKGAVRRCGPDTPGSVAAHLGEQQDRVEVGIDDDSELFGGIVECTGLTNAPADVVHQDIQRTIESLLRLRHSIENAERAGKSSRI